MKRYLAVSIALVGVLLWLYYFTNPYRALKQMRPFSTVFTPIHAGNWVDENGS
jgi:hypothetical protein